MSVFDLGLLAACAWAFGVLCGHPIGYARAVRIRSPRYRRVGNPE